MIRKILHVLGLILVCVLGKAQTFDLLQGDMNPYKGGAVQFYKDLNTVLIESHSEHCNNRRSEMFLAELEIEKGHAKIINKTLSDNCPTTVFVKALDEINKLKKWKKGADVQKYVSIIFYPIDYFDNFKENYTTQGLKKSAEFPGGMGEFRNRLLINLKNQNIRNADGVTAEIRFKVNQEGVLQDVIIQPDDLQDDIKNKVTKAVGQITEKWQPESFRDVPITSSYVMRVTL
ncbi:hypothetical protein [Chryseobacterium sediminis]|uniref:hypothetical protein n=1 Tax=Chryseobacterium sediminis TaxID=1679494 RepID=UPI00285EEB80|nr:hypothetical protein [Chryseobacterium sediminis]MDR6465387.1 hypothetical protein [Chryseobacterium sediminis]